MIECVCSSGEHGHPAYECHSLTTANARLCEKCAREQKIEEVITKLDGKPLKPLFDDLNC
jgi:hypothetical protein